MQFVAGIDQSVNHTGLCVLDHGGNCHVIKLIEPKNKSPGGPRLAYVRDALHKELSKYKITQVIMEGYSYGSLSKKFLLGEIGGVVKLVCYDLGFPLDEAAPKQLKKFVTGNASADKEEVMRYVKQQWGQDLQNDNLADAYGLAQIALQLINRTSTKRHQLEVVKQLKSLPTRKAKRIKNPFKEAI